MNNIDERIVNMQFNNSQFERNAQTSIKTLGDLKKGLDLEGAARSLSNLSAAGRNFSLNGIADGVNTLVDRFSTLGIVGMTVIQNLTNSALNAGKRIASALTIDPIRAGLSEYETKMNAIQTILTNTASKGSTLADVNATLNELNEYSDKTIYNFAEMARNIGTFTAAGVGLKDSAIAIKGIANLAAGSGSNAMQASTAMYQLSQALAAGKVTLMDWNSVVNAGMGGELFQKALEKTAKELGHGRNMAVSFRESLQDGWITADVLIKTLSKFAEDEALVKAATEVKTLTQMLDTMKESLQSGWAQSWENIIGNKEEAAAFYTAINDGFSAVIGSSAEARNEMLKFWKANGGRTAIIQSLSNALTGLSTILSPIEEAFKDIFPAMTGKRLVEISKRIQEVTSKFKIGEETAANIKRTFKGLFAILDIGKQALFALGNGLASVIKYLLPAGAGFLSFTGNIGDFIVSIDEALKSSNAFNKVIENIGNFLKPFADGIRASIGLIVAAFTSLGTDGSAGVDAFSERVTERFEPFKKLGEMIKKTLPFFYELGSIIGESFSKLQNNLVKALDNADFNSIFDIVNGTLFAGILLGLKRFIESLTSITDSAGGFLGGITGILDGVKGSLVAYQSSLKSKTLMSIAMAIGILAASLVALSLIDSKKLTSSLTAMTGMFIELFGAMTVFGKLMGGTGFTAIGKLTLLTGPMIALSAALLILTGAMSKLAALDWNGVAKGLVGIGVLTAELALFMKVANFSGFGMGKGAGLLLLAASISVLAGAVRKFSEIDTGAMIKGLIGVGVVLGEITLFVNATGDAKRVMTTAAGLTVLGVAMMIFSKAISMMGNMSLSEIGKGLMTMAGALTVLTLALNLLPKNVFLKSLAILDMAGAITILANAMKKMGQLSWDEIGRALTGLIGALGIMLIAFQLMGKSLVDATAMTLVIASIYLLANALKTLGSLSIAQVGTGLLTMAGAFAIIGGAGLLLSPLIPVLMGLSATIAIFGVACLAVGAGMLAFSAGLTALAVSGTAGSVALVAVVTAIVGLIPFTIRKLAEGLVEFVKVIRDASPMIAEAILQMMTNLLKTYATYLPKLVDAGAKLTVAMLEGISKNMGKIVTAGIDVVISFIKGVASMLGKIIQAGFDLMLAFINGLADGIRRNTNAMIDAMQNLMSAVVEAGIKALTGSITGFFKVGVNIVDGLMNGIKSMITAVSRVAAGIGTSILESAKKALGIHSPSRLFAEIGKNVVAGMTTGITKNEKQAVDASKEMSNTVVKESSKTVKKSNDAAKKAFDKATEWIDERKYYNQLSLADELAAWERLQKKYILGTEERKKADREVYRIKKEMIEKEKQLQENAYKEQFEISVEWIDERKYYNQMSLAEELLAWQRVQERYLAGTEERKRADREVYRVKKEILEKQKQLEEDYQAKVKEVNDRLKQDIQSVTDEYTNALESRSNALYQAYGLFDEVATPEAVDGEDLINNLRSQVTAFEDWQANLAELAGKGIDAALLEELQAMGPQAAAQIEALNNLSTDRLDAYVTLWQTKHEDARTQAIGELEGMRIETLNKITELKEQASVELKEYKDEWISQTKALTSRVSQDFANLNTNVQISTSVMRAGTEAEFTALTTNIQAIVNGVDWYSVGANIILGMTKGVKDKAVNLANEAANAAKAALKAANKALGINSPSKAFEEIGMYADEGLALGLKKFADRVVSSATNVGTTAVDSLRSTLANISDIVSGDMDLAPTIRPVLDLSGVEAGTRNLNGMFGRTGINVSGTNGKTATIATDFRPANSSTLDKVASLLAGMSRKEEQLEDKRPVSFEGLFKDAVFTVRNDNDIKKIAVAVSKELYNQERSFSRGRGLSRA